MITKQPTATAHRKRWIVPKLRAYVDLLKLRLSLTVAFSGAIGYLLASTSPVNWGRFWLFTLGGLLVTGAANAINQIIEANLDRQMRRTLSRPLPSSRLTISEAILFAFTVGCTGLCVLLSYVNLLSGVLAFVSLMMYAFVYTPLKRVGPVAVWVGAIPGALPPLIGWAAAADTITMEALTLFAIQFIWQFPHFWAIAWVLDDDYRKAGFKLLPATGGRTVQTAWQIAACTLLLIPAGIAPTLLGLTGPYAAIIAVVGGMLFLFQTLILVRERSQKAALQLMFGSFLYLPIVQIAFLLDKV